MRKFFKFILLFILMIIGYVLLVTISMLLFVIGIYGVILLVVETVIDPSLPILVADVLVAAFAYQLIQSKKFKDSMSELWQQVRRNL